MLGCCVSNPVDKSEDNVLKKNREGSFFSRVPAVLMLFLEEGVVLDIRFLLQLFSLSPFYWGFIKLALL